MKKLQQTFNFKKFKSMEVIKWFTVECCSVHERGISCKICNYSVNFISEGEVNLFQ